MKNWHFAVPKIKKCGILHIVRYVMGHQYVKNQLVPMGSLKEMGYSMGILCTVLKAAEFEKMALCGTQN